MKVRTRINYLHYGDALPLLRHHVPRDACEFPLKRKFLVETFDGHSSNPFVQSVIYNYGQSCSKKLSVSSLAQDINATVAARKIFQTLACRGFSHEYVTEITGFPYHLRNQLNLRVAIISGRDLFYPKRVRRYLQRHDANHCFVDAYPAIAFALGCIIGGKWYVLVMQSDIAFSRAAHIRDHFRGWRKVLFACILRHAAGEADSVYLCPSSDVMNGTFPESMQPEKLPESWRHIYDGTAQDFKMKPVVLSRAVNIQIYSRTKPVYSRQFYELKMSAANEWKSLRMFRDLWPN